MLSAEHRRHTVIAILLACLSYPCFNIGDAAIKVLGGRFHFSQIVFLGSIFNLCILCAYGALKEGRRAFRTNSWMPLIARVLLLQGTTICNIMSLSNLPLTTFYTLIFTSPFMVAGLSAAFLKEQMGFRRLAIILLGFGVVLFVFRPGGGLMNIYVPVMIFSAFCYSTQVVITRHVMRKYADESITFLLIGASAVGLLWSAPMMPAQYIAPTNFEWLMFLTSTACGTIAFFGITHAFRLAPVAAAIAPCHYTQIAWAALIGWFAFSEAPDPRVIMGAGALIGLGLYLIWSETRAEKTAASPAA